EVDERIASKELLVAAVDWNPVGVAFEKFGILEYEDQNIDAMIAVSQIRIQVAQAAIAHFVRIVHATPLRVADLVVDVPVRIDGDVNPILLLGTHQRVDDMFRATPFPKSDLAGHRQRDELRDALAGPH